MDQENDLQKKNIESLLQSIQKLNRTIGVLLFFIFVLVFYILYRPAIDASFDTFGSDKISKVTPFVEEVEKFDPSSVFWIAADIDLIKNKKLREQVLYGKELIAHTAKYLGPKGSVMKISNGLNCQNCHLDAGTKPWGNNYGSVKSTYPKYRPRSGKEEDIYKRINDCFERSLNGKALSLKGKEMQAMKAYIEFVGKNVKKGEKAEASGIFELAFLDRAIDPLKGKILYEAKCANCHQVNGEGVLDPNQVEYMYPPLWGQNSYNHGAGLFRMSKFAGYIKYNMPYGVSFFNSQLTDEEAWDIAAYVNSQPRPSKDLSNDWPKTEEKPVDHPFGPYTDQFSEVQHKYGPFKEIAASKKKGGKHKK